MFIPGFLVEPYRHPNFLLGVLRAFFRLAAERIKSLRWFREFCAQRIFGKPHHNLHQAVVRRSGGELSGADLAVDSVTDISVGPVLTAFIAINEQSMDDAVKGLKDVPVALPVYSYPARPHCRRAATGDSAWEIRCACHPG